MTISAALLFLILLTLFLIEKGIRAIAENIREGNKHLEEIARWTARTMGEVQSLRNDLLEQRAPTKE
jgi:hypothetical protein